MAYQTFRNEYMNMPPVTRAYTTACVITTLAVVSNYVLRNGAEHQKIQVQIINFAMIYFHWWQFFVLFYLYNFNRFIFQQLEIASPFQLYFNPILIVKQGQIWRLITTFLFFGVFGFNFFFNMIFTYKYCRMLEEGSFRNRTADFVMMFLFGATCMIVSFSLWIYWRLN